jgi:hypothetical protein
MSAKVDCVLCSAGRIKVFNVPGMIVRLSHGLTGWNTLGVEKGGGDLASDSISGCLGADCLRVLKP